MGDPLQPGEVKVTAGASGGVVASFARRQVWVMAVAVVLVLVVGGVAGSVWAAASVAHQNADKSRQAFVAAAAGVASNLQLAIHDEDSLVVSASAFVLESPAASNAEFTRWLTAVQAFQRYPELGALGEVVIVPAAALPAFEAKAVGNASGTLGPGGAFELVPPGPRPSYCLAPIGHAADAAAALPAGFDFCAIPAERAFFLADRDSGQSSYLLVPAAHGTTSLVVQFPIYRGGAVPATVAARRAASVGWVGMFIDPLVLLKEALKAQPALSVVMRFDGGSSGVAFSSGRAPVHAQSATVDLHNGWSVQTFGAVTASGVWADGDARALLLAGVGLSVALAVLVAVLATGRARARRLVEERTAELRGAQAQLVDTARQAGMAEIATNVLHNVGNVLNSVNVSADLVAEKVRGSKAAGLSRAVALLHEHRGDLGEFLTVDARGRSLPNYLEQLAVALSVERESVVDEMGRLKSGVAHISTIVAAQQSLAGVAGIIEPVRMEDLIDDALRMTGSTGRPGLTVAVEVDDPRVVSLDRHRVLAILVNLITNAGHAMADNDDRPRQLDVRVEATDGTLTVTVADNGEGIPAENLTRIFVHGFTTRATGHGFGLHSSALAAKEMGGTLTVESDGPDTGARFTLTVPLARQPVLA